MRRVPPIPLLLTLGLLAACDAGVPALEARISPEARAADFPDLVPLGPLLAEAAAPAPRAAAAEGTSLEARAASLRRRAAALRALPL